MFRKEWLDKRGTKLSFERFSTPFLCQRAGEKMLEKIVGLINIFLFHLISFLLSFSTQLNNFNFHFLSNLFNFNFFPLNFHLTKQIANFSQIPLIHLLFQWDLLTIQEFHHFEGLRFILRMDALQFHTSVLPLFNGSIGTH